MIGQWRLTTLTDRGNPLPLTTRRPVVISFDGSGRASWFDGANTTSSSCSVTGNRVAFTDLASTLVGPGRNSPAYAISRAFWELESRPRFTVADDELTLRTERYEFGFVRTARSD